MKNILKVILFFIVFSFIFIIISVTLPIWVTIYVIKGTAYHPFIIIDWVYEKMNIDI